HARRRDGVQDDDVRVGHATRVLVRRANLERHLRVRPEDLLEEEVPGAHEEDVDLARRRQHRVGDVVHRQVVVDPEARRDEPTAAVAEGQDDRAPDARLERHVLLGDRPAVELQGEREGLSLGRVVHERDERLVVGPADGDLPDRQARDADVPAPSPPADPADPRAAVTFGWTPVSITITSAPSPRRRTSWTAAACAMSKRDGLTSLAFMEAEVSSTTTTLRAPSPITVTAGRARARDSARRARIWR